jgi:two-component sensor histidine kinase
MPDAPADAEPGTVPAARRRSRPIALYLLVLALVALVPAFVFSAFLLQRNNEVQQRVVETLVTGTSRTILEAVEREISGNITTLRVLGTAPALLTGDFQSFYTRVKTALEGTDTVAFVLDENLMSIISTRGAYGDPPRPTSDPESAREALETGRVVVSNVVFGAVSQRWVFNVLLPVTVSGEPMVLGLSRSSDALSAALLVSKLPEGWNVALIDAQNAVIAASPGSVLPGEPFALASLAPAADTSGWIPLRDGNTDLLAVVQRSNLAHWSVFAWAPRDLITQPLSTTFWSLIAGGLLLAGVVILVIYGVTLQIGRSVHALEDDARLLGAGEQVPPRAYPITEIATVSASLADASSRRKAAETEVRLLMRELAHRSKNQLAVIAAMAKQSAKSATSVPEFVASFERRIHSLSRSTDLLLAHGVAGVELRDVLSRQIDPLCPIESGRVTLTGPPFKLSTQAAQILGMAAHELASNASAYGAFAVDAGRLEVTWKAGSGGLKLEWRERAASVTGSPQRRGFGTTVLESMVGRSLNAEVTRTLNDDGIQWNIVIPLESLDVNAEAVAGGGDGATSRAAAAPEK